MAQMLSYRSAGAFGRDLAGDRFTFARLANIVAQLIGWTVLAAVLFAASGALLGPLGPVFVMTALAAFGYSARVIRRRRAVVVLGYVEQALRLNLPLPRMLDAAARSEKGRIALRLTRLREMIDAGATLSAALAIEVPEVSAQVVAQVRAAESIGRLPDTLRHLLAQERRHQQESAGQNAFYGLYCLLMPLCVAASVSGLLIYIIPQYVRLFRDYHLTLPPATRWLVYAARDFWWLWEAVLVAGGALIVAYTVSKLWYLLTPPRRSLRPRPWIDAVLWRLPFIGAVQRDHGLADACRLMGDALRVGHPMDRAVLEAAQLRLNDELCRRLEEWAADLRQGQSISESARRARLPRLVCGMLASARGNDGAAQAMEFLARYYQGRFSRARLLLRGALVPAVAIFFGAIVCIVALSIFLPMMQLVHLLSEQGGVL